MIVVRPILSVAFFFFVIYIRLCDITTFDIFDFLLIVSGGGCQVFLPPSAWHTLCRGQKARHSLSFCSCPSEKKRRGQIKLSKMELFCHQHTAILTRVATSSMFLILHLLHLKFQREASNGRVMDCRWCRSLEKSQMWRSMNDSRD